MRDTHLGLPQRECAYHELLSANSIWETRIVFDISGRGKLSSCSNSICKHTLIQYRYAPSVCLPYIPSRTPRTLQLCSRKIHRSRVRGRAGANNYFLSVYSCPKKQDLDAKYFARCRAYVLTTLLCIFLSALFTIKLALLFCAKGLCWRLVAAAAVKENPETPERRVLNAEENSLKTFGLLFVLRVFAQYDVHSQREGKQLCYI